MTDRKAGLDHARKLGRERMALAESIGSPEEWKERWTPPASAFPFELASWKQCICYTVSDYAAEVGFLIDVLGLPAPLFGPDNALLTSPDREFHFQVAGPEGDEAPTPPESIGLMFYIDNMLEACEELESRGVEFTEPPAPAGGEGSTFYTAELRTPNGVPVSLWGVVREPRST